jgi:uncharacterized protein
VRVVLDTNVLVSGLLWHGAPHELVERVRAGSLTSAALLTEFDRVVRRRKFRTILTRARIEPHSMLRELSRLAEIVDASAPAAQISRDPDDDLVLAVAAASRVDLIVSGDGDLLALRDFQGIRIVDPASAVQLIART